MIDVEARPGRYRLDLDASAVVVVDMQNDFVKSISVLATKPSNQAPASTMN